MQLQPSLRAVALAVVFMALVARAAAKAWHSGPALQRLRPASEDWGAGDPTWNPQVVTWLNLRYKWGELG